jgi:hypothetical protein
LELRSPALPLGRAGLRVLRGENASAIPAASTLPAALATLTAAALTTLLATLTAALPATLPLSALTTLTATLATFLTTTLLPTLSRSVRSHRFLQSVNAQATRLQRCGKNRSPFVARIVTGG